MPLATDARKGNPPSTVGSGKRTSFAPSPYSSSTRTGDLRQTLTLPQPQSALSSIWGDSPPLPPDDDMLFIELEQLLHETQEETRHLITQTGDKVLDAINKAKVKNRKIDDLKEDLECYIDKKFDEAMARITARIDEGYKNYYNDMTEFVSLKLEDMIGKIAESLLASEKATPSMLKMADSLSYSAHGLDVSFGTMIDQSCSKNTLASSPPLINH